MGSSSYMHHSAQLISDPPIRIKTSSTMLSHGGKILGLWIIVMDFTHVWGCYLKQIKATKSSCV